MRRAAELEIAILFEYGEVNPHEFERFYEGIEQHHLVDDPMYLALPRDHPLARKRASASRTSPARPGSRRADA